MKEGISLGFEDGPGRGWLPDGSRLSWLNAPSGKKADQLPVRVTEHNAIMPSGDGDRRGLPDLYRHHHPPRSPCRARGRCPRDVPDPVERVGDHVRRGQDHDRRSRNRTSGPVLRSGCPRLVIQDAWAWLTATQLVRASAAGALRSEHAAARALRRKDAAPVTADEESFTAVLRHTIRSMTSTQVTASSSLGAIAAAAGAAARAALRTVPARTGTVKKEETVRARGTADRGTARHPRRDTRVRNMHAHNRETDFRARTEHNHLNTPRSLKHLKSVVLAQNWTI